MYFETQRNCICCLYLCIESANQSTTFFYSRLLTFACTWLCLVQNLKRAHSSLVNCCPLARRNCSIHSISTYVSVWCVSFCMLHNYWRYCRCVVGATYPHYCGSGYMFIRVTYTPSVEREGFGGRGQATWRAVWLLSCSFAVRARQRTPRLEKYVHYPMLDTLSFREKMNKSTNFVSL